MFYLPKTIHIKSIKFNRKTKAGNLVLTINIEKQ